MTEMLLNAAGVLEGASQGSRPARTDRFFHDSPQRIDPSALGLPMFNMAQCARSFRDVADDVPQRTLISHFFSLATEFYEEFVPVYLAWGAASVLHDQALAAARKAAQIAKFAEDIKIAS